MFNEIVNHIAPPQKGRAQFHRRSTIQKAALRTARQVGRLGSKLANSQNSPDQHGACEIIARDSRAVVIEHHVGHWTSRSTWTRARETSGMLKKCTGITRKAPTDLGLAADWVRAAVAPPRGALKSPTLREMDYRVTLKISNKEMYKYK